MCFGEGGGGGVSGPKIIFKNMYKSKAQQIRQTNIIYTKYTLIILLEIQQKSYENILQNSCRKRMFNIDATVVNLDFFKEIIFLLSYTLYRFRNQN